MLKQILVEPDQQDVERSQPPVAMEDGIDPVDEIVALNLLGDKHDVTGQEAGDHKIPVDKKHCAGGEMEQDVAVVGFIVERKSIQVHCHHSHVAENDQRHADDFVGIEKK